MDFESAKKYLENNLTEKRYIHSLGVMKKARELAEIYGENKEEAAFAGLIHDIAKEFSKEKILDYSKKHNIEIDDVEKEQLGLMHAKLGASIAKEKYNASKKIQNAILYHTTGNKKMDRFAKIIYVADKVEENRVYDIVDELRMLAEKDLDKTILILLDFTIEKSIKNERLIHPDTIGLRNEILRNR